MVTLERCVLEQPRHATLSFHCGRLESEHSLLVFELTGKAANSREFTDVYGYAPAMIFAGLEAWNSAAVVLDCRQLEYEYGDLMTNVVSAPARWYDSARSARDVAYIVSAGRKAPEELPFAIVVSNRCRDGLTSLLTDMMSLDPADLLFDSLEDAFAALEKKLAGWKPY